MKNCLKTLFIFVVFSIFFFLNEEVVFAREYVLQPVSGGVTLQEQINNTGSDVDTLVINDGKTYDFTDLQITKKNIKVTNGKLNWMNSTLENGRLIFDGERATGTISGGSITITEEIWSAGLSLENKASIDVIDGLTMKTFHTTIRLGSGASIGEIKSGSFTNGKSRSTPVAVLRVNDATIDKISGGTFKSVNGAALRLEEGAKIGEISDGTFDATELDYDYIDQHTKYGDLSLFLNPYSAIVMFVNDTNLPTKKALIEKISGGDFSGYHAIFMRTGVAEGIEIGEISGGTFKNISNNEKIKEYKEKFNSWATINTATIYTTQQAKIGAISGGYFESDSADVMHFTFLLNSLPKVGTEIGKISGGTFIAKNYGRAIMLNGSDYKIGSIENGVFIAADEKTYAIDGDGKIGEIKNGIFYGGISTGGGINTENNSKVATKLEADLSLKTNQPDMGVARYFHKGQEYASTGVSPKFLKGNFALPTYQTEEGYTYSYIPSFYRYEFGVWESGKSFGFFKHEKDNKLNADGEYFFWSGSPVGYFDNTNKKASYSSLKNDWYDGETNGIYDRKEERIYSLYPTLEDKNIKNSYVDVPIPGTALSYKMAYLRKRPILHFDANLPENVTYTGDLPKKQHILPFSWDAFDNTIDFDKQGKHWDQVFLVPDKLEITVNSEDKEYTFKGWNTKPDGKGRNLKLNKFYAMPLEDVTLYALWETKEKQIPQVTKKGEPLTEETKPIYPIDDEDTLKIGAPTQKGEPLTEETKPITEATKSIYTIKPPAKAIDQETKGEQKKDMNIPKTGEGEQVRFVKIEYILIAFLAVAFLLYRRKLYIPFKKG